MLVYQKDTGNYWKLPDSFFKKYQEEEWHIMGL